MPQKAKCMTFSQLPCVLQSIFVPYLFIFYAMKWQCIYFITSTSLNGTNSCLANMTQQMSQQFGLVAVIQDNSLVLGARDWSVFCLMIGCCRGTAVEYLGGTGSASGKAAVSHRLFGTPGRASLRIPSALMQIKAQAVC